MTRHDHDDFYDGRLCPWANKFTARDKAKSFSGPLPPSTGTCHHTQMASREAMSAGSQRRATSSRRSDDSKDEEHYTGERGKPAHFRVARSRLALGVGGEPRPSRTPPGVNTAPTLGVCEFLNLETFTPVRGLRKEGRGGGGGGEKFNQ